MTTATATTPTVPDTSPMRLIELAVEHKADPDQLAKLMDLRDRWEASVAAEEFGRAMSEFQAACPPIHKGRKGGHGAYAGYDDIMTVIRPHLAAAMLSVSFDTTHSADTKTLTVICTIRRGRHEHKTTFTCPVPAEMKVNSAQQYGAALSYAKRYALIAAANLVVTDEDTDADSVFQPITEEQAIILREMLEQLPAKRQTAFMEFAGARNVNEISASRYTELHGKLKAALAAGGAK